MFNMSISTVVLLVIFSIWSTKLYSDNHKVTFQRFSLAQGLSQSIVSCIIQDQKGFMWFGPEDGLNKYDGYKFNIIRNNSFDNNSLSYNQVEAICEDKTGKLWIGTFTGGLNKYDPDQNRFTHYRFFVLDNCMPFE